MRGSTPTTARATTRSAPARTPTRTVKARPPPPAPRRKGGSQPTGNNKAAGGGGKASRSYINITGFPFPLGPFFERKTVVTEVRVWDRERERWRWT